MANRKFGEVEGLDEWARRVNEIMDEMLKRDYVPYRTKRAWQPATNVYESDEGYTICVELAGMEKEQVDVVCRDERRVTVTGQRPMPRPQVKGDLCVHVMEIDDGLFERQIDLPEPFEIAKVSSHYEKGLLWVKLPKKRRP